MSETNIPQGEIIIGRVIHQAMMNCMIVPYDDPDGWFYKQFPSQSHIEEFALAHNLVMKNQE